jgi:pantoate--beta-alanine ligase
MILFKTAAELSGWLEEGRSAGKQIGFVPTMGALHSGHISLIDISRTTASLTVCSIFVNPAQFNDPKDFRKYPITLEKDIDLLEQAGVDALFLPEVEEIYPQGTEALEKYELGRLESIFEGKYRPGHFQGVCQVVRRLLDKIQPHHLFMGQKDYQQCLVIRRLLDLTGSSALLHTCPIVREADGLAMSSRNLRLTEDQRKKAPAIYRALSWLKTHRTPEGTGTGAAETVLGQARAILTEHGLRPDYIEIADATDLGPVKMVKKGGSGAAAGGTKGQEIALVAAFLGEIRFIDNMLLKEH